MIALNAVGCGMMSVNSISSMSPGCAPLTNTGPVSGCTSPASSAAKSAIGGGRRDLAVERVAGLQRDLLAFADLGGGGDVGVVAVVAAVRFVAERLAAVDADGVHGGVSWGAGVRGTVHRFPRPDQRDVHSCRVCEDSCVSTAMWTQDNLECLQWRHGCNRAYLSRRARTDLSTIHEARGVATIVFDGRGTEQSEAKTPERKCQAAAATEAATVQPRRQPVGAQNCSVLNFIMPDTVPWRDTDPRSSDRSEADRSTPQVCPPRRRDPGYAPGPPHCRPEHPPPRVDADPGSAWTRVSSRVQSRWGLTPAPWAEFR